MKFKVWFLLIYIAINLFGLEKEKFSVNEKLSNLSQDIAKYTYLISLDIDYDKNKIFLKNSFDEFEKIYSKLKKDKIYQKYKEDVEKVLDDEVDSQKIAEIDNINSKLYNKIDFSDSNKTEISKELKWILITSKKLVNDIILIYRNYKFDEKREEFKTLYQKLSQVVDNLEKRNKKIEIKSKFSWINFDKSLKRAVEYQDEELPKLIKYSSTFNKKIENLINSENSDLIISENNETDESNQTIVDNLKEKILEEKKRVEIITLLSKEALLIQKMSKDAILFSLKIDKKKSSKDINKNIHLFKNGFLDLKKRIEDKKILSILDSISYKFKIYQKNIHSLLRKEDKKALLYIVGNDDKISSLLFKIKEIYKKIIENEYFKKSKYINLSLHLEMLTQKLLKNKLLILGDFNPSFYKKSIENSILKFDTILSSFIIRDKNRAIKLNNSSRKIKLAIRDLKKIWEEHKRVFKKLNINDKELTKLIRENGKFEQLTISLVKIFEKGN